jgi:hypothetical protein
VISRRFILSLLGDPQGNSDPLLFSPFHPLIKQYSLYGGSTKLVRGCAQLNLRGMKGDTKQKKGNLEAKCKDKNEMKLL